MHHDAHAVNRVMVGRRVDVAVAPKENTVSPYLGLGTINHRLAVQPMRSTRVVHPDTVGCYQQDQIIWMDISISSLLSPFLCLVFLLAGHPGHDG